MRTLAAFILCWAAVATIGADEKVIAMEAGAVHGFMREMKPTEGVFVQTNPTKEKEGSKKPQLMYFAILGQKDLSETAKDNVLTTLLDGATYGPRPMGAFEPEFGIHFRNTKEVVTVLVSLKGNCATWRIRGKETKLSLSKSGYAALSAFLAENIEKKK